MNHQLEFEPAMSNFLDEGFSNAKGKAARQEKKTVRKEKRAVKKDMKAVCGRKPLLKKKQGDWQKCVDEAKLNGVSTTSSRDEDGDRPEVATTPAESGSATASVGNSNVPKNSSTTTSTSESSEDKGASTGSTDSGSNEAETGGNTGSSTGGGKNTKEADGKILGMPKPAFFIVAGLVVVGGFLLVTKMMKKGVAAPPVA